MTGTKDILLNTTGGEELHISQDMGPLTGRLRPLLELWTARCDDGLPQRSAFTPRDLKPWLSTVHVYEVIENGRFVARLLGTAIVQAIGADQTGRSFGAQDTDLLATRAFKVLSLAVVGAKPLRTTAGRIASVQLSSHAAESLWLPLGEKNRVQQILAATVLTSLG